MLVVAEFGQMQCYFEIVANSKLIITLELNPKTNRLNMKSLLTSFTLVAAFALASCGSQEDPEKERLYTDSLANVRYEERVVMVQDSLAKSCTEEVEMVQHQIDSLNQLIASKAK